MQKVIPQGILEVLTIIEQAGFECCLVGGCVRDRCMGRQPHDYDITTSATPEELKPLFERVLETGIAHGTLTVLWQGEPIEITTYRVDGEYTDHRHPDGVRFTRSLQEDLARRDFTINAMAMNRQGEITDLFGGRADLEGKIIRCVGDPEKRLEEDALRILRGLRFAARLGFAIEPKTAAAMEAKKELLGKIAAERIFAELFGLLQGPFAADVLRDYRSILQVVLPEMGAPCFEPCPPTFGMAKLLEAAPFPAAALDRLKVPNAFKSEVLMLIQNQNTPAPQGERALHRLCAKLGGANAQKLFAYRGWAEEPLQAFLQKSPCLSVKDLALGGKELMDLGLQGAAIGAAQEYLLQAVIEGMPNEKERLLDIVKSEMQA